MAKEFEKGTLIVLVLVFLVGIVFVFHALQQQKTIDEVISITDSRTEYLLQEVENLNKRIDKVEKVK